MWNYFSEISFWDQWFQTHGLDWPEDYRFRLRLDSELQEFLRRFISEEDSILDVGAGPLTSLGKRLDGYPLRIIPVDPLAFEYDGLLHKYHIIAPVRTLVGFGERLVYSDNTFDVVHAANSVDHSDDPIQVLREMLRVTKPTGRVLLFHRRNEGERNRYEGLHKFNLSFDYRLMLWNNDAAIDIQSVLNVPVVRIETDVDWVGACLTKQ